MGVKETIEEQQDYMVECRRWLHRHAELAWKEFETTRFIVEQLQSIGIETHLYDGHTGCWAVIKGGKAGDKARTILLRADIDAMPGNDIKRVTYASKNIGAVHSCGHDGHTAMLLGAAKTLYEMRDQLTGNVKLVFEAAEEIGIGAEYYVSQGILDGVDGIFGMHMWNDLDAPYINMDSGLRCSSFNIFNIQIHGRADATCFPDLARDAILAGAKIVDNLQILETHMRNPLEPTVIAVGKMHGGMTHNTYCDYMELSGTIRTFSKYFQEHLEEKMEHTVKYSAELVGCSAEVEVMRGAPRIVHDNEMMNSISQNAARKLFGNDVLQPTPLTLASDTFGFYMEKVPGVFAYIGTKDEEKGFVYPLHNDRYDFDEAVLPRGAALFVQVAIDFMNYDTKDK